MSDLEVTVFGCVWMKMVVFFFFFFMKLNCLKLQFLREEPFFQNVMHIKKKCIYAWHVQNGWK